MVWRLVDSMGQYVSTSGRIYEDFEDKDALAKHMGSLPIDECVAITKGDRFGDHGIGYPSSPPCGHEEASPSKRQRTNSIVHTRCVQNMMAHAQTAQKKLGATMQKLSFRSVVGPTNLKRGHVVKVQGEAKASSHGHVIKLDDAALICVVESQPHAQHYRLLHARGMLTSAYSRQLLECLKHPIKGWLEIEDAYNIHSELHEAWRRFEEQSSNAKVQVISAGTAVRRSSPWGTHGATTIAVEACLEKLTCAVIAQAGEEKDYIIEMFNECLLQGTRNAKLTKNKNKKSSNSKQSAGPKTIKLTSTRGLMSRQERLRALEACTTLVPKLAHLQETACGNTNTREYKTRYAALIQDHQHLFLDDDGVPLQSSKVKRRLRTWRKFKVVTIKGEPQLRMEKPMLETGAISKRHTKGECLRVCHETSQAYSAQNLYACR